MAAGFWMGEDSCWDLGCGRKLDVVVSFVLVGIYGCQVTVLESGRIDKREQ